jgi:hypothetical protein
MADGQRSSETEASELRAARILRTRGLWAEYTTGQSPSGEWFALGTIRSDLALPVPPARILVGAGRSAEDAVGGLLVQMETEARRIGSR